MVTSHRRLKVLLLGAATLLYIGVLIAAAATRKPWNDEAMAARAAYDLSTEGRTGVDFWDEQSPFYPGIKRHSYYIFPFQLCVLAVWYKVAGFSLLSTRVISIVWTLLMLAAINQIIWRLTKSGGMALLSTVLAALDYHVMTEAAFGRYDTMVAALGFGAYALFLSLRQKHFLLAITLSNCCIAMAGATHPNGVIFFLGLWFLVLYFDRSRFGWKTLGAAAIPYVVGAIFWAKYIFEDFPSFQGQLSMNSGGRYGILHPVQALIREIQYRYIRFYGLGPHSAGHAGAYIRLKALSLVAYAVGIVGCLSSRAIRSDPRFKPLLALLGIHFFFLTFCENMKFAYYLVHLVPLYWAALAVFVYESVKRGRAPKWAVAVMLGIVAAVQVGGVLAKIRLNDYARSYLPAVEFVKRQAAPTDLVAASCSFGFGYGFDRNLIDDDTLGYYNGKRPKFIVAEEIYELSWKDTGPLFPAIGRHIRDVLSTYELIYDAADYKVYRARP
jgi:hypothetical protein